MKPVLVLGGYGNFGKRIVELLARQAVPVIAAGRDRASVDALVSSLAHTTAVTGACFDLRQDLVTQLERLQPAVVINTCGPFQGQDHSVARMCIERRVPYIDLADGRDYVTGIAALDDPARRNDTLVVSGASTVPGLTSAVLDAFRDRFDRIDFLDFGIAPGQKAERGLATTKAILGYVGKPLKPCAGYPERFGWQDLHVHRYPELGRRWMANCEVPDLDLLPERYGIGKIRFSAGMELLPVHFGIWALSWLVRIGLPIRPETFARRLLAVSNVFDAFGSANGGMHVVIDGQGRDGRRQTVSWHIVAFSGHGPYIPAVPAVVLAKRIRNGSLGLRGAMACVGLVGLQDYLGELAHLDIRTFTSPASEAGADIARPAAE